MSLTDQLREAIHNSNATIYRIATDSGLPCAVVYRFVSGERDIKLSTANELAEFFGMRFTRPRRTKSTERKKR
jgi:hypothetical protein